ncbi:Hypothetical protein I595_354 [Croceitalea dokdonensis DOKDO 023]|uniref:Uncharacterized protein n=2 Tax=Croceitalea TaxID=574891 RepID=A0A0P7AZ03_9FLAO|nr:Hypothetical protein I595_354 [Croceitalea dokdonensis DOKDO 023]
MQYLNQNIEALAKKRRPSLVRKQIACGIFQETAERSFARRETKPNDRGR